MIDLKEFDIEMGLTKLTFLIKVNIIVLFVC